MFVTGYHSILFETNSLIRTRSRTFQIHLCPVEAYTHLFQILALESCRDGELAWKRARSDSTGELIKRGRRKDPITQWKWRPPGNRWMLVGTNEFKSTCTSFVEMYSREGKWVQKRLQECCLHHIYLWWLTKIDMYVIVKATYSAWKSRAHFL